MQLSPKLKIPPHFLSAFLKATSNFEHFEKNDESYSSCILHGSSFGRSFDHCERTSVR